MASKFGVTFAVARGQSFSDYMVEKHKPVAVATTKSMDAVADDIKSGGRREIAAAGFPTRKPEGAFRVDRYPKGGQTSLTPAVYAYSKIPYFGVFQTGATITGDMWVPLRGTPPKFGSKRASIEQFKRAIGSKAFVRSIGGKRYWMAPLTVPKAELRRGKAASATVSVSRLRSGQHAASSRSSSIRWVPLFVQVQSVTMPQKIDVLGVVERARDALPGYFAKFLQDDKD